MKQGYEAYRTAAIDTADQGKLILLVYDVAIKNCKLALEKFDCKDKYEERVKHLFKSQDAIAELLASLNLDAGGEIARNLYSLYRYMLRCLTEATTKNKKEKIEEVLSYLEELRNAWEEAAKKVRMEGIESSQVCGNIVVSV